MNKKVKRKSPVDHSAFTASTQDILKTKWNLAYTYCTIVVCKLIIIN
jgi:hypothetical protein